MSLRGVFGGSRCVQRSGRFYGFRSVCQAVDLVSRGSLPAVSTWEVADLDGSGRNQNGDHFGDALDELLGVEEARPLGYLKEFKIRRLLI